MGSGLAGDGQDHGKFFKGGEVCKDNAQKVCKDNAEKQKRTERAGANVMKELAEKKAGEKVRRRAKARGMETELEPLFSQVENVELSGVIERPLE